MTDVSRRVFLFGAVGFLMAMNLEDREEVVWLDQLETPGRARSGEKWTGFTDGVMGGVSQMQVAVEEVGGETAYRMTGSVRTENNGGFIQIALPLGRGVDLSDWDGIRLRVRGNQERYAVHLRTDQNGMPWDYFSATFVAGPTWHEIDLPFARFRRSGAGARLQLRSVRRVALVAIGRDFEADVSMAALGVYRSRSAPAE